MGRNRRISEPSVQYCVFFGRISGCGKSYRDDDGFWIRQEMGDGVASVTWRLFLYQRLDLTETLPEQ